MKPPIPNSYWVIPDRLLAGEHPYGVEGVEPGRDDTHAVERMAALRYAGIDHFIDLTEVDEMPDYRPLLPRSAEYVRHPIVDQSVPDDDEWMHTLQTSIRTALARRRRLYVHCRAGIGRTGVVIGCYLAGGGRGGKEALKLLNRLWRQSARSASWPRVPQTPQQAEYIRRWPGDKL